jgi:hypothetical protein
MAKGRSAGSAKKIDETLARAVVQPSRPAEVSTCFVLFCLVSVIGTGKTRQAPQTSYWIIVRDLHVVRCV